MKKELAVLGYQGERRKSDNSKISTVLTQEYFLSHPGYYRVLSDTAQSL